MNTASGDNEATEYDHAPTRISKQTPFRYYSWFLALDSWLLIVDSRVRRPWAIVEGTV
ncbi:hypothetical protein [Aggregatimonas sangjinii]|uniref:hypothetical protein n=1 Tax=Aggregatimonas sangjinii TaxID=2583587 RepID=UPI0015860F9B|nr:hypothetical protein [Aggregatimonas sangjinii]